MKSRTGGKSRWSKKVYDAPYGKTITAINSDKASRTQFVSPKAGAEIGFPGTDVAAAVNGFLDGAGGAITSAVLASFGIPLGEVQAVARLITGYINNGDTVVKVPAIEGTLVKFFHIVGDTGGADISDDGIGFEMETIKYGNGLRNMQARAERLGGKLKIESEIGAGTKLRLSFMIT